MITDHTHLHEDQPHDKGTALTVAHFAVLQGVRLRTIQNQKLNDSEIAVGCVSQLMGMAAKSGYETTDKDGNTTFAEGPNAIKTTGRPVRVSSTDRTKNTKSVILTFIIDVKLPYKII